MSSAKSVGFFNGWMFFLMDFSPRVYTVVTVRIEAAKLGI